MKNHNHCERQHYKGVHADLSLSLSRTQSTRIYLSLKKKSETELVVFIEAHFIHYVRNVLQWICHVIVEVYV